MSDSQRSWISVKGWLDKSSQIGKRFVPRRNSKRDSSAFEPKEVYEPPPTERLRNKENPPQLSAAPSSRNSQRRMSTSSRQYATGYSETQYSDDKRRYSQSRPSTGPPSFVNTEGYPKPRISKRHSDQQSYTTQSASIRLDDVDRRLSRRRSNTGELQNGKVLSDRRESRALNVYPEEISRRARGGEPIRVPYPNSAPASRGRPTAGSVGDVVGVSKADKGINDARDGDLDMGNHLGPPRSSMSQKSSGVPDGISQSRRLLKRRDSRASEHGRDDIATHMKQMKLSEDLEKGRARDRSRSRSRNRSIRELIRPRREEPGTALHNPKSRGRSLSRGSRFSSRSRSVDQRARRQDPGTEHRSREKPQRRDSALVMPPSAGKERPLATVNKNGYTIRGESEGGPNLQRTKSRSPSRNSVHSRRHLSRSPSRASVRSQTRDIPVPRPDSGMRRPSDASDHVISGRTRAPSIISRSLPVGFGVPGAISHSPSRHVAEQEARYMEEENEARRRRRASTAPSIENSRISPTADPRSGSGRGILRRTGRISSFVDGPPPKPPPPASTNAEPSRTRRTSRSRSGSRTRAGKSDEEEHELRNNTIHNARNLKYQPHRDGYPSSSTSPSGRRGLVPVRYPTGDGNGRHAPLRRYTTSSVGAMPHLAMARRPSYSEHPLAIPSGAGAEMWYQGWPPNGIPINHDPYADPYVYGVHPSQIPPSHAQYPSWPPGAYPLRRGDSGPVMRPGSRA